MCPRHHRLFRSALCRPAHRAARLQLMRPRKLAGPRLRTDSSQHHSASRAAQSPHVRAETWAQHLALITRDLKATGLESTATYQGCTDNWFSGLFSRPTVPQLTSHTSQSSYPVLFIQDLAQKRQQMPLALALLGSLLCSHGRQLYPSLLPCPSHLSDE